MVKIYGIKDCKYCQLIKDNLKKNNIPYEYYDVSLEKNKKDFHKLYEISGSSNVPMVLVGKMILVPNISYKTINEALKLIKENISFPTI